MSKVERKISMFDSSNTIKRNKLHIEKKGQFEKIFKGYEKIKAITYSTSISFIDKFFEENDIEQMILLIGDKKQITNYKKELYDSTKEKLKRIVKLCEDKRLQIYFPKNDRIEHGKLYILKGKNQYRIIHGSANLSLESFHAKKQSNILEYFDCKLGHSELLEWQKIMDSHFRNAELFMGDLLDLMDKEKDKEKDEVIEIWLCSSAEDVKSLLQDEEKNVYLNINQKAMDVLTESIEQDNIEINLKNYVRDTDITDTKNYYINVSLGDTDKIKEKVSNDLKSINPISNNTSLSKINPIEYVNFIQKKTNWPVMYIDYKKKHIGISFDNKFKKITCKDFPVEIINTELEKIENFINSYDLAQSSDYSKLKMYVMESLLHFISSPFSHQIHKIKKHFFPYIDRGPRFLFLHGTAYNGKTQFLKFCMYFLTGEQISLLSSNNFTYKELFEKEFSLLNQGNVFPLVFDDLIKVGHSQKIWKHYWEVSWNPDMPKPQLIVSSNQEITKDWLMYRVKFIHIDAQFNNEPETMNQLTNIYNIKYNIFSLFSSSIMKKIENLKGRDSVENLISDDLWFAREAYLDLYKISGRKIPEYFPKTNIEKIYDEGLIQFRKLFEAGIIIKEEYINNDVYLHFSSDIYSGEIEKYRNYLPSHLKGSIKGKKLIVENSDNYDEWIGKKKSLYNRLKEKFF